MNRKQFVLCAAAVFLAAWPLAALDLGPYQISLTEVTGLWLGQSEEVLYSDMQASKMVSQLLWDMMPVVYLGAEAVFAPANPTRVSGPYTRLAARFGLPGESGVMEDRDWMTASSSASHFSSHTNIAIGVTIFDAELGWNLPFGGLALRPYLAASSIALSFEAYNGTYTYPADDGGSGTLYGRQIGYKQSFNTLGAGVSLVWPINRSLTLDAQVGGGGVIKYDAEDTHYYSTSPQEAVYKDSAWGDGGLTLDAGAGIALRPAERLSLRLAASCKIIAEIVGDTLEVKYALGWSDEDGTVYGGVWYPALQASGGALSLFDVSLSVSLAL